MMCRSDRVFGQNDSIYISHSLGNRVQKLWSTQGVVLFIYLGEFFEIFAFS